jgi:hypothetical protein
LPAVERRPPTVFEAIDGGHLFPEEAAAETADALDRFFGRSERNWSRTRVGDEHSRRRLLGKYVLRRIDLQPQPGP